MNGRLIPSTPIWYEMFHSGIQFVDSSNCKPLDVLSNRQYSGAEMASVASDVPSAIQRAEPLAAKQQNRHRAHKRQKSCRR